jgi:hypothetical protein
MIPEIKSTSLFVGKGPETLESVNAKKTGEFKLVNKMLVLSQNGHIVGKFAPSQISHQIFGDRLIAYVHTPKVGKEIVFEVTGQSQELREIGKMLGVHNLSANYKSPLQLNFATTCKESVLTSDQEANLRGFLNLFIVLSVITYSRLILVSLKEFKGFFMDSVTSPAQRLHPGLLQLPVCFLRRRLRFLLFLGFLHRKTNQREKIDGKIRKLHDCQPLLRVDPVPGGHGQDTQHRLRLAHQSSTGS